MFLKLRVTLILVLFSFPISSNLINQQISSVKHPDWSYDKVIYEVNLRQYTEEGTFKAFEEHLPKLKEMGVDILWFMPIHPIGEKNRKGSLGSYYSVKDYKAVNPEHGAAEDFKSLVDKIHEMDMYVIIDWVANHTAWDNDWVEEHPEFYTKDSAENFVPPIADWADVIDLNFNNRKLQAAMLDAMKYWVEEYDIDGYRCDVAGMVPIEFWLDVREELDNIKPVFLLAEAWEPELHQAFDMTYSWDTHHLMSEIAQGKKNVNNLKAMLEKEKSMYPESAFRMQFTSNHDENTWNGTVYEKFGDGAEAFAALTFLIPGMPLIYSGQEAGLDKRLQFFEKDPIQWKEDNFRDLYKTLCKFKEENKALWNGEKGGELKFPQVITASSLGVDGEMVKSHIFAIGREADGNKVIAIFNLSNHRINQVMFDPSGERSDYKNLFTNELMERSISLDPWEYKIFYKN